MVIKIDPDSFKSYEISLQLENCLRQKKFNEDDVATVFGRLNEKKKDNVRSLRIAAIGMSIFVVLILIGCIVVDTDLPILLIMLSIFLVLYGGTCAFLWHAKIGKVAKRWNQLLKENYPDICSKYKL